MRTEPRASLSRFALRTAAALLLLAAPLQAADWPLFRGGPDMRGVASAKLPDAPALLWSFKTAGPVKSSAVIGGGRVYIGSSDSNVYCLDMKTGAKIWAFKAEDAVEAPPTLYQNLVLVGANDAHLYCLDAATGELKWKFEVGDKIVGAVNVVHNPGGPALAVVGS